MPRKRKTIEDYKKEVKELKEDKAEWERMYDSLSTELWDERALKKVQVERAEEFLSKIEAMRENGRDKREFYSNNVNRLEEKIKNLEQDKEALQRVLRMT